MLGLTGLSFQSMQTTFVFLPHLAIYVLIKTLKDSLLLCFCEEIEVRNLS